MQVVESFTEARSPSVPNADRLVIADGIAAVIDGSTAKPWDVTGVSGADVADAVAHVLRLLPSDVDEFLALVAERIGGLLAGTPRDARPCATAAVVVAGRREVWRIGDPWLVVDGELRPSRRDRELAIARRRAAILRAALDEGDAVEALSAVDPGRAAILADLQALAASRNAPDGRGFGALDGTLVPPVYVEVLPLGPGPIEIVLATDGYPVMAGSLAECEQALARRLKDDPLLIEEPPMTKGLAPGATSYDDRTYLRVRLDARG